MKKSNIEQTFKNLEEQEARRKKFKLIGIILVILTLTFFMYLIKKTVNNITWNDVFGFLFIAIGSILIMYFSQKTNISYEKQNIGSSTINYLNRIKKELRNRKINIIIGISLQFFFIVVGVHFLVFPRIESIFKNGIIGVYYGFMLAFFATSIGVTIFSYNKFHKKYIEEINSFLRNSNN